LKTSTKTAPLHPLHRIWRLFPARQRRRLLSRAGAVLAPRVKHDPLPAQGGIAVGGELSRATGLGEGARLMLRALGKLGVPTWQLDVGALTPAGAAEQVTEPAPLPPPAVPLVLHVNSPVLPLAMLRIPRALLRGRRVIGYWYWELPCVPPDWRAGVKFVHEVWVPSAFTAAAIEPLLPGKVRVVPPPLAVAPPVPSALDRAAFGLPDDAVVVLVSLNLASSFERKNPLAAIAAFRAAFGERRDRLLVLKIGNPDHFPDDFARVTAAAAAPNIRIDTRILPHADSHALTAAADIILSLHRSEAFGLIPAEAMLLGKPVIVTGWSGNMEFMDADSAALVGCRLLPTHDPRKVYDVPGAVWAEPDPAEAIAQLRRLADDPAERAALGIRARAAATACLGADKLAEAVSSLGLRVPG
jgi:glycosyltransferase involved in cell wall biosynthesis